MKRALLAMLCVALAGAWTNLWGQDAVSAQRKAQNKLLAYRAARADAVRKLAERINGLHLSSETTVRDFVTESDVIRTAMLGFLAGAQEVDRPKYADDDTCQVTMEVPMALVIVNLEKIYREHYKGNKVRIDDFQKLTVNTDVKILRETGQGAPRPELQEAELQPSGPGAGPDIVLRIPAYWKEHVTGQGRLMAERAARVEGMRRLAERIAGIHISSETTVRDFVAESDKIQTISTMFLRGAKEMGVRYHTDELIVEVEMQVKLRTVLADIKTYVEEHYRGDTLKVKAIEEATVRTVDELIKETGMGVPPEQYLKNVAVAERTIMATAAKAPPWMSETMRMTGQGATDTANDNKAQAKLMAFRAAELDARRKLAEKLDGLMISSNTSVRDFVAQSDEIRTAMLSFQQGASVVENSQKLADDGTATVTVEIDLKPLWNTVIFYQKKLSITIR